VADKPVERTNAADAVSIREAQRRQRDQEKQELADMQEVLASAAGRRFLWRLLGTCKLYESPANSNGAIQSMNIGRGDVGRELLVWISRADKTAYAQLMLEQSAIINPVE
jgi:hypothetical protein